MQHLSDMATRQLSASPSASEPLGILVLFPY